MCIVGVEYVVGLVCIGWEEVMWCGFDNVEFVVSLVEVFEIDEVFDFVFIFGLFVYFNDDQVECLFGCLNVLVCFGGMLLLCDGIGIGVCYEINDCFFEYFGV